MAKIAGQKNDGAWFRTNAFIKKLDGGEKSALEQQIAAIGTIGAAFDAIKSALNDAGVPADRFHVNASTWATSLSHGIPRQVWFGVTTFDKYDKSSHILSGNVTYDKQIEPKLRVFAIDLRYTLRTFIKMMKEAKDLANLLPANQGNPGGIADADAGT